MFFYFQSNYEKAAHKRIKIKSTATSAPSGFLAVILPASQTVLSVTDADWKILQYALYMSSHCLVDWPGYERLHLDRSTSHKTGKKRWNHGCLSGNEREFGICLGINIYEKAREAVKWKSISVTKWWRGHFRETERMENSEGAAGRRPAGRQVRMNGYQSSTRWWRKSSSANCSFKCQLPSIIHPVAVKSIPWWIDVYWNDDSVKVLQIILFRHDKLWLMDRQKGSSVNLNFYDSRAQRERGRSLWYVFHFAWLIYWIRKGLKMAVLFVCQRTTVCIGKWRTCTEISHQPAKIMSLDNIIKSDDRDSSLLGLPLLDN